MTKEKNLNIRIDCELLERYHTLCATKNSSTSKELRQFMASQVSRYQQSQVDFRDSLQGIHNITPQW